MKKISKSKNQVLLTLAKLRILLVISSRVLVVVMVEGTTTVETRSMIP